MKKKKKFENKDLKKSCVRLMKGFYSNESLDIGKDSKKRHCQTRKTYAAAWQWKTSLVLTRNTQKVYDKFENTKLRRVLWFICAKQYTTITRCTRKLSQQVHTNIRAWSCIVFVGTSISLASMPEENRTRIRFSDWCQYVTNGRESHQRWNVPCHASIC